MKWRKIHGVSYGISAVLLVAIVIKLVTYYSEKKEYEVGDSVINNSDDIVFGDSDAEISVVMYGNYQCSHCIHFLKEELPILLNEDYNGKKMKLIYRLVPFSVNKKVWEAYETAMCVNKYGEFQKFHEMLLFDFSLIYTDEYSELLNYIMIHNEAIASAVANHEFEDKLNENVTFLKEMGITGTPVFIINKKVIKGSIPLEKFQSILNSL